MQMTCPRRKFSLHKAGKYKSKNLYNGTFYKNQNLDLSNAKESSITELQGLIGNKAALTLLEELGGVGVVGLDPSSMGMLAEINRLNANQQLRKEDEEFADLYKSESNFASDSVRIRNYRTKYNNSNKPTLNSSFWQRTLRELINFVNVMKVYDVNREKKEVDIQERDMLLDDVDKVKRKDVQMLFSIIDKLPDYSEDEQTQKKYFRTIKFIVASGIDMKSLFKNTGDYKAQREVIINSLK